MKEAELGKEGIEHDASIGWRTVWVFKTVSMTFPYALMLRLDH
jgi:hypothetical protein